MAQSPKQGSSPTKNRSNQFGTQARDPDHTPVSGVTNYPLYQDATGTPVNSPVVGLTSSSAQLLNIPAAAISITIIATVVVRVSDTSGNTAGYAVIPANVPVTIPVVTPGSSPNDATGQMWLLADSTSGNVSFIFNCQ